MKSTNQFYIKVRLGNFLILYECKINTLHTESQYSIAAYNAKKYVYIEYKLADVKSHDKIA